MGRLLAETARDSDIVGRIDSDTFAIYALECDGNALARRIARAVEHATEAAADTPVDGMHALSVAMSIGITEVRADDEFDPLISRALVVLPKGNRARTSAGAA
jgi:GGDEF domain-containing protein